MPKEKKVPAKQWTTVPADVGTNSPAVAKLKRRKPRKKRQSHDILKSGDIVKERWCIEKKLGEGGCGTVYQVCDTWKNSRTNMRTTDHPPPIPGDGHYALKVELNGRNRHCVLKMEVAVMRQLRGRQHCCQLFDCGKSDAGAADYNWLVMTLVGPALSDLRMKDNDSTTKTYFTTSTTIRIGLQTLEAIQELHDIGFIHRDIKPSNFAVGKTNKTNFYLLDFGLARQFSRDSHHDYRPPRETCKFRGTYRYCAPSVHDRKEQCRRDDVHSWLYMLIDLMCGLPWDQTEPQGKLASIKKTISHETLLDGCPPEFHRVLTHIEGLDYYDAPNYHHISGLLQAIMHCHGYAMRDPYDWQLSGRGRDQQPRPEETSGDGAC